MIIGDGDIASAIKDRDDILFFASGVSNSRETSKEEFDREMDLLRAQGNHHHIVYFSTLSVFYQDTPYTQHKLRMENLVKSVAHIYTIMRLGNITWGKNPNTLINYLRAHPDADIRDEYRYICERDDFDYWLNMIPNFSCEMNVPGKRMKVKEVVEKYT
jgi:hypothetical protein